MSTASHISKLPPRVARPLSLGLLMLFLTLFAVGVARTGSYLQATIVMARCDAASETRRGTVSATDHARGHFWLWLDGEKIFFSDTDTAAQQRPAVGERVEVSALGCRRVWLGQNLWQLDADGSRGRQLQHAGQLETARARLWQPFLGGAVFVLAGLWLIATFFMATARAFSTPDSGPQPRL